MVTYKKGNLLADPAGALVNTVNTVGAMGKGIALAFRDAYPHNYQVYKKACLAGQVRIGELLAVTDCNLLSGAKLIINMPTKVHWRYPSEYSYVEQGLTALRDYIVDNGLKALAMPLPGCGNGGLDWHIVRPMLEKALSGLECRVTVYIN